MMSCLLSCAEKVGFAPNATRKVIPSLSRRESKGGLVT